MLARSAADNSGSLLLYFLWLYRSRLLFLTDLWNITVKSILRYAIRRKQILTVWLLLWHLARAAIKPLLIIIFILTNNIRVINRRGSLSLLTHECILLQLATQGHKLVLTGTASSSRTVLVCLIHTMINRLIKLRRHLRLEELIRRCCNHWLLLKLVLMIMEVLLRPRQLLLKVAVNLMLLWWASRHTSIQQHVNSGSSASIRTSKTATDTISTTHKNLTLGSGNRVSRRSRCRMRQSSRRRPLMMVGLHLQHLKNLTCSDGHGLL